MNQDSYSNNEPVAEESIDLLQLWHMLLQNKWIIILSTLVCLVGATAIAYLTTPKYEAKLTASFADDGSKSGGGIGALAGQFGGLAEIAGVNIGGGGGGGTKENSLAYLKSRVFIEGFINDNNLMPILYEKIWDTNSKKWIASTPNELPPSAWKAYELFSKSILDVQSDKKTGLITLTITWKNREQAATWANDLIRRANANLREKAIGESQRSIGYLEKELQKTSVTEVQNTIYRIMESQIKTMMMANTQEQFAFKVIDPAAVMDEDAFVKPKRSLLIALGGMAGIILGIFLAFIRHALLRRELT